MSLEHILQKIIEEAEQEASRLRKEAQQRAEQMIASNRQEAEKKAATIINLAEQEAQTEAMSIISQARLEKRLALLEVKRKWVDWVLNKAFEQADLLSSSMKKTIVTRRGIEQEEIEAERLRQDLRQRLEKLILELLGI